MPRPRLTDDGRAVELDLHGTRIDDAHALVRRTAALAAARGRTSMRVVHGASTSDPRARNPTIRHALLDVLERGELRPQVTDHAPFDGHTLLALAVGAARDPKRIVLADVLL